MFGKLKGKIESIENEHIIVDVNGVGYLVHCSAKTLSNITLDDVISLFIETCVREESIALYGFTTKQEKECFLAATTVKGIGPKMAMQILSKLTPDQFCIAVNMKDRKVFGDISGIGPKMVDRIFAELRDRKFISDFTEQISEDHSGTNFSEVKSIRNDAVSVLINLGIRKSEAFELVSSIISEFPHYNLNEIIKSALNKMAVK
ncbi:MAG: Holliday junction branch migration protein RuvA [Rickettsiales bacterium]|nr:Holliday junction branch migration protein RuvA [Rickettsiales bacterium]